VAPRTRSGATKTATLPTEVADHIGCSQRGYSPSTEATRVASSCRPVPPGLRGVGLSLLFCRWLGMCGLLVGGGGAHVHPV
jgi:hypothetical protein